MAQERTLDVAELIEGRKLGSAPDHGGAAALHADGARRLRHADAVVRRTFDLAGMGRQPRRVRLRAYSAHLFGYLVGAVFLTFFGDRLGRKNIIMAGAVDLQLFTFAPAFASTSQTESFALRFRRRASGSAARFPPASRSSPNIMPHKIRATTIGLMFVAYNLGARMRAASSPSWTIEQLAGTRCSSSAASPRSR